MMDDYDLYYEDKKTQNNPKWDETKSFEKNNKKHRVLDEVITVLRALVNIFDIIESKFGFL